MTFCNCLFCTPIVGVRDSTVPLATFPVPTFVPMLIPLVPAFTVPIPDTVAPDPLLPVATPLVVKLFAPTLVPLVPPVPLPLADDAGLFAGLPVVLRQNQLATVFLNLEIQLYIMLFIPMFMF